MTAALKFDVNSRAFGAALIGLVLVLSAGAWFVAVSPARSHASKLATSVESKQSELSTAQHQAASERSSRVDLGQIHAAMPTAVDMPQVVDQLNALAARAGVTLDTVTPQAAVLGAGYTSVPLTVVVDGHYTQVEQFLRLAREQVKIARAQQVKASGRLFDVQAVGLQQTEPAPTVTATLTVSAFYYTGAAAPAPATTTDESTTTPSS